MYFVRVYENFPNCIDAVDGQNYTFQFELSYGIGFLVIAAETININVLGIYFRYKVKREQRATGVINRRTLLLQTLVDYCRWFSILLVLGVTFMQAHLIGSKHGKSCMKEGGPLFEQGTQLNLMIILQLLKTVLFASL